MKVLKYMHPLDFSFDERGAVTVDFVVITGAVVGLGLAVYATVSGGLSNLSGDIKTQLTSQSISVGFAGTSGTGSAGSSASSGSPGSAGSSNTSGNTGSSGSPGASGMASSGSSGKSGSSGSAGGTGSSRPTVTTTGSTVTKVDFNLF